MDFTEFFVYNVNTNQVKYIKGEAYEKTGIENRSR